MKTKIEWATETWNPIVGCSKISEGCQNCYAERMACRLAHMGNRAYQDVTEGDDNIWFRRWNGKTAFVESALEKPLHWKTPRRIFVCSMGDLFHESVPDEWIDQVFEVIQSNPQHRFLLLTKRPRRMADYINTVFSYRVFDLDFWMTNIWAGVTVENQEAADERIPVLLQIPAAVRFVSVEPILGPVKLTSLQICEEYLDSLTGDYSDFYGEPGESPSLSWVICGGESGPGARPMNPVWARSLRDQCRATNTPFFFKQWGEWCPPEDFNSGDTVYADYCGHYKLHSFDADTVVSRVGKKKAGRLLDGVTHDAFPDKGACL